MDAHGNDAQREAPCSVKFCNVTYVLYVSIWSVQDPTEKLASLFQLEHARLIYQGKILKKGDVWPGTVVQLVGTKKAITTDSPSSSAPRSAWFAWWPAVLAWLCAVWTTLLAPFKFIGLFFHSMIYGEQYQSLPQRRYAPVDPAQEAASKPPPSFRQPGAVPLPRPTDTVE
ncbi:Aste57867_21960 [Aphanomyces stellatus]|uniref:Aste57867_21960 protein n=1 Tax=Aphanomyces stellatus TaxID=120398 RepID=A0A485LIZ5_9STRA|nr:hypothetical protein As57867_021891 [Aphanomyces stellatus]VFT98628.1 Aste57867_21960 [Aphanomyces stellatus]